MTSEKKVTPSFGSKARWSDRPKLSPDAASRQGEVTKLAFEALGGRNEAIAYLNTACARLGGRPLDLAVESADGLRRVAKAIASFKPLP